MQFSGNYCPSGFMQPFFRDSGITDGFAKQNCSSTPPKSLFPRIMRKFRMVLRSKIAARLASYRLSFVIRELQQRSDKIITPKHHVKISDSFAKQKRCPSGFISPFFRDSGIAGGFAKQNRCPSGSIQPFFRDLGIAGDFARIFTSLHHAEISDGFAKQNRCPSGSIQPFFRDLGIAGGFAKQNCSSAPLQNPQNQECKTCFALLPSRFSRRIIKRI